MRGFSLIWFNFIIAFTILVIKIFIGFLNIRTDIQQHLHFTF